MIDRRGFLALAGLSWLTPVSELLARQAEKTREPAQSLILLWLSGGPSQLETFDPHPDKDIAGGTKAIGTALKGVQLAEGFEQLADQMGSVTLIRSMVSKEGDHERGTYFMKTGYRPDPTVVHPSIGAICCHELPVGGEIEYNLPFLAHNAKRIVRALEIIEIAGEYTSSLPRHEYEQPTVVVALECDFAVLDARIEARVDAMWEAGLVDEVRDLEAKGIREAVTARRAVGYAETLSLLGGEIGADECVELIKRNI